MQYSYNELHGLGEIQNSAFWRISFGSGPLNGYSEALGKRAVAVDPLPKATPQNVDGVYHGYPTTQPGTINYQAEVTITFIEPIDMQVAKAMHDWYKQYYEASGGDVTGSSAGWSQLFQDVTFTALDRTDGTTATIKGYKGLPTDFTPGTFTDGADGGQLWQPTITIKFNYYNWE